jgi:hypothetical protein
MNLCVRTVSAMSLVGAVLAAAVGCHSSTSPSDALSRELARREAQWRAAGIHEYAFDYDVAAMVNTPPVRIEVRADTVAHVVVRATGQEVPRQGWPTVDSLFARARALVANDQYHPTIAYDAQRGFPTEIDAISHVPDTGYSIKVSDFAPAAGAM